MLHAPHSQVFPSNPGEDQNHLNHWKQSKAIGHRKRYMKRHVDRITSSLFLLFLGLSVALASSGCAARVRVYDTEHGDYHRWDRDEDRAYRRYWMERHEREPYRDYNRLDDREQRDYWNWRHGHQDEDRR